MCATKAPTHLDKSRANLQMNWSHPNQTAHQSSTEMCNSGGRPQTAALRRSLHAEPTGEPLQLNLSFHCTDKQQFPESQALHCPNLHEVWGLQLMRVIEVRANMYSQMHASQ